MIATTALAKEYGARTLFAGVSLQLNAGSEDGIAFSKGLSSTDDPARLHKVSKASPRVVIFTQHDPRLLIREAQSRPIHKIEQIEVYALDPAFLDRLGALTERNARWTLLRNDGQLYVTVVDETVSGPITRHALLETAT